MVEHQDEQRDADDAREKSRPQPPGRRKVGQLGEGEVGVAGGEKQRAGQEDRPHQEAAT